MRASEEEDSQCAPDHNTATGSIEGTAGPSESEHLGRSCLCISSLERPFAGREPRRGHRTLGSAARRFFFLLFSMLLNSFHVFRFHISFLGLAVADINLVSSSLGWDDRFQFLYIL